MWKRIALIVAVAAVVLLAVWVRRMVRAGRDGSFAQALNVKSMEGALQEIQDKARKQAEAAPDTTAESPGFFRRVGGILAVRSDDARSVAEAIGLQDGIPANWSSANMICASMMNTRTYVS